MQTTIMLQLYDKLGNIIMYIIAERAPLRAGHDCDSNQYIASPGHRQYLTMHVLSQARHDQRRYQSIA